MYMVFINSECCDGNRADNYSSSSGHIISIRLKSTKSGPVAYKSVFCLAYQHGFPNHFKNNLGGKVSRRRIRAYIVLYNYVG